MIGLGTFYNALGVVFGGLLGLLIGQRLSEDFHETLLKVTGVAVFVLGIAGTLEKMLVVHGSHVESHGSMMLILSLVIGTVIGELLKIEEGFERLGTWLKEKTGNQGDSSFVDAFMTTALTICIGAMAVSRSCPGWLDRRHLDLVGQGYSGYGHRFSFDRFERKGCDLCGSPTHDPSG